MSLAPLLQRKKEEVTEWKQTGRCARNARKYARPTPRWRAKREPVKIEPRPEPVIEKSDRPSAIPRFRCSAASTVMARPAAGALMIPAAAQGYDEETLETLSRQIEFS